MTPVVLIGLGVMWAILLVPGWVRSMRDRSGRQTTIDTFHEQLNVMGRAAPRRPVATPPGARLRVGDRFSNHHRPRSTVPQSSADASVRRRDIVALLAVVAVVTLVGWLVSGLWQVALAHGVVDALLGGYLWLLVRRRREEAERMAKVHYLPRQDPGVVSTTPVPRRSAN